MKICDMTIFYSDTGGGIRTYLQEKQKFLQSKRTDIEHLLIIPGQINSTRQDSNLKTVMLEARPFPWNPSYRVVWNPKRFLSVLEQEHPDIIEVGSPFISPLAALEYRKKHSVPLIGFFHANFPETYIHAFPRAYQFIFQRMFREVGWEMSRQIYNRLDMVFAPSLKMKQLLLEKNIHQVVHQSFGVDGKVFHPDHRSMDFRRQLKAGPETTIYLFVGRLHREKGIDIVLKAFKKIKDEDSFLLIIGEGNERKQVEAFANHDGRVHYLGYVSNRIHLAKVYASSDIFVMPCADETFGMAYLEALSSGLPIVGIQHSGIMDEIDDRFCLRVQPNQVDDFADQMIQMKQKRRQWMPSEIHQYIQDKGYAWETVFQNLFRHYESLLMRR